MTFGVLLALGGCTAFAFMVTQFDGVLRKGSIERRQGLKPATPKDTPVIFYGFLLITGFGTIVVGWGTIIIILRLLER